MQTICECKPAFNRQKRKYMSGQDNTAVHLCNHGKQRQHINDCQENPHRRVFPTEQIFVPAPIQDMVGQKQDKHPCPTHSWAISPQNWYPIKNSRAAVISTSTSIFILPFISAHRPFLFQDSIYGIIHRFQPLVGTIHARNLNCQMGKP